MSKLVKTAFFVTLAVVFVLLAITSIFNSSAEKRALNMLSQYPLIDRIEVSHPMVGKITRITDKNDLNALAASLKPDLLYEIKKTGNLDIGDLFAELTFFIGKDELLTEKIYTLAKNDDMKAASYILGKAYAVVYLDNYLVTNIDDSATAGLLGIY